jgi:hypothetical protein
MSDRGAVALVVEVVFHVSDEQHGRAVAAQMIDRAHEIANLPELECDLDVNVRWSRSSAPVVQPPLE